MMRMLHCYDLHMLDDLVLWMVAIMNIRATWFGFYVEHYFTLYLWLAIYFFIFYTLLSRLRSSILLAEA